MTRLTASRVKKERSKSHLIWQDVTHWRKISIIDTKNAFRWEWYEDEWVYSKEIQNLVFTFNEYNISKILQFSPNAILKSKNLVIFVSYLLSNLLR